MKGSAYFRVGFELGQDGWHLLGTADRGEMSLKHTLPVLDGRTRVYFWACLDGIVSSQRDVQCSSRQGVNVCWGFVVGNRLGYFRPIVFLELFQNCLDPLVQNWLT